MEELEEADLDARWEHLLQQLTERFGKTPDLNAVLFLIGIQELNKGIGTYTKEQKQDLMHVATCKVLSLSGFYELERVDEDGWPHYRNVKPIPFVMLKEQERLMKWHVLEYFSAEENRI
jgi:hypothetical protein